MGLSVSISSKNTSRIWLLGHEFLISRTSSYSAIKAPPFYFDYSIVGKKGTAVFKNNDELINAIFWERAFELIGEQHDWFDTHRMGAKWLAENIAKPKNAFLSEPEQEALRDYNYGKGFKYDEVWTEVRKGLICAFPKDELVLNTALDVNLHDPNLGQNPQEVFWK